MHNLATIVLLLCYLSNTLQDVSADDRKSASELIKSRGFDVDEMEVISQNYPLKIYRIINPLADRNQLHRVPVLMAHGIAFDQTNMMASSKNARPRKPKINDRVTLYTMENGTDDRSLHFYLSNNNYDVWIVEARATNTRSQRRIDKYSKDDKGFWDFSIDEQALIDLPLQIETVLHKTGAKKVAYIAYSQSTTFMFALLSMRPEFEDKLACFIAMAPVVYSSHLRGLVWPTAMAKIYLYPTTAIASVPDWIRKPVNFLTTYTCSISFVKYTLCRFIWKQFSGTDKNAHLDGGMTEDVLKSTSMKTFEQYVQNAVSKDFRMFDYKDEMRNMEEYGQTVPPRYNISKISLKTIVLFRGTNDYLSDPEDQMILLSELRVPLYEDHILVDYSHIDFLVSPSITRDINEPILRVLDKLTHRSVRRVAHTLGKTNAQMIESPSMTDVEKDHEMVKPSIRSQVTGGLIVRSQSEAEKSRKDGVAEMSDAKSLQQQLTGER